MMPAKSSCRLRARYSVIARSGELNQIEAVAEGVGHVCDAAIFSGLYLAIEGTAQGRQSRHHPVEIRDDEIQMHRCPVSLVVAGYLSGTQVGHGGSIRQKKNREIGARQLDPARAEATLHREAE